MLGRSHILSDSAQTCQGYPEKTKALIKRSGLCRLSRKTAYFFGVALAAFTAFTVAAVAAATLASVSSTACLAALVTLSYAELAVASADFTAAIATSEPAGAVFRA